LKQVHDTTGYEIRIGIHTLIQSPKLTKYLKHHRHNLLGDVAGHNRAKIRDQYDWHLKISFDCHVWSLNLAWIHRNNNRLNGKNSQIRKTQEKGNKEGSKQ